MRDFLTTVLICALLEVSVAQERPTSGPHLVDETAAPWSGIALINNSVYGRCTGVLIAPDTVLTAAHCLYARRTGFFVRPQSVHVLLGFNRGDYGFHTTAAEVRLGEDYDPARPALSLASDFAVLRLVETAPSAFVPMRIAAAVPAGRSVVAAGFAQERSEVLTSTPPCVITGGTTEGLVATDCAISRGLSGGPLIDLAAGELVGILVAAGQREGHSFALAIPAIRAFDVLPPS